MLLSALLLSGLLTTPLAAPVDSPSAQPQGPSPLSDRRDTDPPVISGPSSNPVRQGNPDAPVTLIDPRNNNHNDDNHNDDNDHHNDNGPSSRRAVPEIDPATATTALSLLAGGLLVIRGRRR
jgi:hypothetical protein